MLEFNLKNGLVLSTLSPLNQHFAFVDVPEYLADALFIKHKVTVHFMEEYTYPDSPYRIIFCRCRKWDAGRLTAALNELPNKMLIFGYADYPEFCRNFLSKMETKPKRHRKGEYKNEAGSVIKEADKESAKSVS